MKTLHVALATCDDLPGWEVDDKPLHEALERFGIQMSLPIWDDPAVDWSTFDACLIRTTWDYTEKHTAFVSWAERISTQTRLFNPAEIVRWNTNKSYLHQLARQGIPIAPTLWLDAGTQVSVSELLGTLAWEKGFIKPVVGATARGTLRFATTPEGLMEAQAHVDGLLSEQSLMVQPYLKTVETEGEYSVIFVDGKISHCVQKIPVAGDYRVQDDFGAADHSYDLPQEAIDLAHNVLDVVPNVVDWERKEDEPLLYARVDFLRDDEGQFVLNELELVEPSLFLRHGPNCATQLAEALLWRIS